MNRSSRCSTWGDNWGKPRPPKTVEPEANPQGFFFEGLDSAHDWYPHVRGEIVIDQRLRSFEGGYFNRKLRVVNTKTGHVFWSDGCCMSHERAVKTVSEAVAYIRFGLRWELINRC